MGGGKDLTQFNWTDQLSGAPARTMTEVRSAFSSVCATGLKPDSSSKGVRWLCHSVKRIFLTRLVPLVHLEGRATANQYRVIQTDHL